MRAAGAWALGIVASAVAHLGAGAALMAALQPEPVTDQPTPESRLNVEAQQVERSEAAAQKPPSETAESSEPEGTALGVGAIPQSAALPRSAPAEAIAPIAPQAAAIRPPQSAPQAQVATAAAPPAPRAQAEGLPATPVAASTAEATGLSEAEPEITATAPALPPIPTWAEATEAKPLVLAAVLAPATVEAGPAPPPLDRAQQVTAEALRLASAAAPAMQASPRQPPAQDVPPLAAPGTMTTPQAAPAITAPLQEPEVTAQKALLAFPSEGQVDPVSLAAFQSFTQPDIATGTDVRDALSAALSIPCARMQVIFDPDTTTLELTGHIPDPAQRRPLLAALQEQMGADIAVADNLLILPAPQCAALSGIASVGLPQSTDQITNPLIVGEDTHARAFDFRQGQPLVIDMGGADYEAFVYLDYFDADGNVIHLSPNDRAPLQRVPAKAPVSFGARRPQDPGLLVQIGPPFGQEIAAAFAASVPLYDGLRPIVEPAGPYLAWMRDRVAEARAAYPDFKGEWVYFFVSTAP